MFAGNMTEQGTFLRETLFTELTGIGTLASVCTVVLIKTGCTHEQRKLMSIG